MTGDSSPGLAQGWSLATNAHPETTPRGSSRAPVILILTAAPWGQICIFASKIKALGSGEAE